MLSEVSGHLENVKALAFDVFGTVVDWRSTVRRELLAKAGEEVGSPEFAALPSNLQQQFTSMTEDKWEALLEERRDSYMVFTRSFVPGQTEWKDIDVYYYESLVELLDKRGLTGVYSEDEVCRLSYIWHYLQPWADSATGIKRLGTKFVTTTLSNGNESLLRDLNDTGTLGFQVITSTAEFGAYKTHPSTYLGVARKLGLEPREVAMVAAHLGDLQAARSNGLRTIYIERPQEEAWSREEDRWNKARTWVDVWISEEEDGLVELAARLGLTGCRDAKLTSEDTTSKYSCE